MNCELPALNEFDFGGTFLRLFLKSMLAFFGLSVSGSGSCLLIEVVFEFSFLNFGFLRSEPILGMIATPPAIGDFTSVLALELGALLLVSSSDSGS